MFSLTFFRIWFQHLNGGYYAKVDNTCCSTTALIYTLQDLQKPARRARIATTEAATIILPFLHASCDLK